MQKQLHGSITQVKSITPDPCPLCDQKSEFNGESYNYGGQVECKNPECQTIGPFRKTKLEAIYAWSTRAPDPVVKELVEALERCIQTTELLHANAFKSGLVGTIEWDNVAGGADIWGAVDQARTALKKYRGET